MTNVLMALEVDWLIGIVRDAQFAINALEDVRWWPNTVQQTGAVRFDGKDAIVVNTEGRQFDEISWPQGSIFCTS